jgi:hypothetical protein
MFLVSGHYDRGVLMAIATATALTIATIAASSGTAVAGAVMASKANKHAADLQAKATGDALTYEKERDVYARGTESNRYGQMMRQNAPLVQRGHAANARMADLLGLPQQPAMTSIEGGTGTFVDKGEAPAGYDPHGRPLPPSGGQAGGGQMVQLRAPDGSMKSVPAEQADHYIQRGAQRV